MKDTSRVLMQVNRPSKRYDFFHTSVWRMRGIFEPDESTAIMKIPILFLAFILFAFQSDAQDFKGLFNKAKQAVTGKSSPGLGADEIAAGLKEALIKGTENGTSLLSRADGFFANAAMKILMPPEAKKIESTLRTVGMGRQVDQAILTMNRAAEDACKTAAPIFVNAIRQMSISDAIGILRGGDTAATGYLRNSTSLSLTNAFRPVIEQSLQKVDATKYWNTIITNYNRVSFQKINPDLTAYVTERALNGIFFQVAQEEKNIRANPAARTTDLLKKVFGGQ